MVIDLCPLELKIANFHTNFVFSRFSVYELLTRTQQTDGETDGKNV